MKREFYPQRSGDLVFISGRKQHLRPLIVARGFGIDRHPEAYLAAVSEWPYYVTCWTVDAYGEELLRIGDANETWVYPLASLRRGVWSFVGPVCVEDT